jgi:hypothetical protein
VTALPRHTRFLDLSGKRFGRCVVIGLSKNRRWGARWVLRCDCGQEFEALGYNLRDVGLKYACPTCRPRSGRSSMRSCGECGSSGHNRQNCPRVVHYQPGAGVRCLACAGLPHRRPRSGCRGCGAPHGSERPPRIEDQFAAPRGEARVFPATTGIE